MSTDATGVATTRTRSVPVTSVPLVSLAVMIASPAPTAVSCPSALTVATLGALEVQVKGAYRRSPAFENAVASRRIRCPEARVAVEGDRSIFAAGPGTIWTSMRSDTGRPPGTRATTVTVSVPVDPLRTSPVESTSPSKRPPCPKKRTIAPGTGLPSASTAVALIRMVSCAGTVSLRPGWTTTFAIWACV
jgi:hypothetical protein